MNFIIENFYQSVQQHIVKIKNGENDEKRILTSGE